MRRSAVHRVFTGSVETVRLTTKVFSHDRFQLSHFYGVTVCDCFRATRATEGFKVADTCGVGGTYSWPGIAGNVVVTTRTRHLCDNQCQHTCAAFRIDPKKCNLSLYTWQVTSTTPSTAANTLSAHAHIVLLNAGEK